MSKMELILDMNQMQTEEDSMGVDQIPVQASQTHFTPIPREGLYNRESSVSWWE